MLRTEAALPEKPQNQAQDERQYGKSSAGQFNDIVLGRKSGFDIGSDAGSISEDISNSLKMGFLGMFGSTIFFLNFISFGCNRLGFLCSLFCVFGVNSL